MVSALKNAGANVNYNGGWNYYSAAHRCIAWVNVEGFRALVNAGADLKQVYSGRTVIEYAASTNNYNLINVVCTSGASLRELESALKNKDERRAERAFNGCPMSLSSSSALVDAVKLGYLDVVKKLIAYGANVKVTNSSYKTYFHYACEATRN
jgi:ankyrin repeat protein